MGDFLEYAREAAARVQHDLRATAPGEWVLTADETGRLEVTHDGRSAAGAVTNTRNIGEDPAEMSQWRVTMLLAKEAQRLVGELGGKWPHCPFHASVLFPSSDAWECMARYPTHAVARIGSLSDDSKEIRAAVAVAQPPLLRRIVAHGTLLLRSPGLVGAEIGNSLDLSERWQVIRVGFPVVDAPRSIFQWLVAVVTIYTVTRPLPGRAFTGVKVPFLPLGLHQPVFAVALILLSMTPIDCIVGLPLVLGWAGVLTLGQAAAAVALALMAHASYSPSVLRLLAPRSAPDPGKWAEDNPQARLVRRWLLTLPILVVVYATPALFTECQRWAAHHNADPVMLFTAICTGGCALVTAVMRVARSHWNLGDRDADDLFHEVFWALLGVFLAFLPAAFRLDWAPTLFGGLAVPLIITRARISAAKAAEHQAERPAYWKPAASRQGTA